MLGDVGSIFMVCESPDCQQYVCFVVLFHVQVMCQWVEDLRKQLCKFWLKSLPVFFNFMGVVAVGVAGAYFILKVLKLLCPSCEHK